eukprot:7166429-Prymnesium_polylepis.2
MKSERAHLLAVDRLAARAIVVGEVAALAHEGRDHTVEGALLVPKSRLPRAQLPEVLRQRAHTRKQSRARRDGQRECGHTRDPRQGGR